MADMTQFQKFLETLEIPELESLLQDARHTMDFESEKLIKLEMESRKPDIRHLEKWVVGIQEEQSRSALSLSHAEIDYEETAKRLIQRIQIYIWSDHFKEQKVMYPASWLEAFKERWFPSWLLKRFPVNKKTVVLSARALYPDYVHGLHSVKTGRPYIIIERADEPQKDEQWQCTSCNWIGKHKETLPVMYRGVDWQSCPSCRAVAIPTGEKDC